ncbi:hypothetical protein [Paenibacillus glucanolyticus]|uniref:hypothetical protein n=1 Tax=Paenibacillus glucanolyticus TaxID=59843 RepID=UPI00096BE750|nr:hypothetical protein [Paenibacillus glucanolyticus]OMF78762.1 hypothetical protein BK142_10840 [Paenibacillus glucanolyticus]
MKPRRSVFLKMSVFVIALSLTACSGNGTTEPVATPETPPPVNEEIPAPGTDNEQSQKETRPESETFDIMTGEGNQPHSASLQQGEGFSLYVFEKFDFDAAKGRLFLTSNPEYYVDIELLPADYDLTELETAGQEELKAFGEVSNHSGELVEHPLGSAELYLQTSNEEGIRDYIVWQSETGDAFLFRLRNPKGEEASDFAGPVLVSLSTVQIDS